MNKSQQILNFIYEIRNSHSEMVNIFTRGSCLNFHLILRKIWPEAELFYNINHVVSKIDDRYYDILGDVTKEVIKDGNYKKLSNYYNKKGISKALKQMLKAEYKINEIINK